MQDQQFLDMVETDIHLTETIVEYCDCYCLTRFYENYSGNFQLKSRLKKIVFFKFINYKLLSYIPSSIIGRMVLFENMRYLIYYNYPTMINCEEEQKMISIKCDKLKSSITLFFHDKYIVISKMIFSEDGEPSENVKMIITNKSIHVMRIYQIGNIYNKYCSKYSYDNETIKLVPQSIITKGINTPKYMPFFDYQLN